MTDQKDYRIEIPPAFIEKMREPVLILSPEEAEHLEELLGMELIYGVRDEHPGKYCISRLALATAMFNDADVGKRFAVTMEDDGTYSGCLLIDIKDQYKPEDLKRAERLHELPSLAILKKLATGGSISEEVK